MNAIARWPACSTSSRTSRNRWRARAGAHTGHPDLVALLLERGADPEAIPDQRCSDAMLSGLPVRDYRADVDIEPAPEGPSIRWRSTYRLAGIPGTGWLFHRFPSAFIARTACQLAARAALQAEDPVSCRARSPR